MPKAHANDTSPADLTAMQSAVDSVAAQLSALAADPDDEGLNDQTADQLDPLYPAGTPLMQEYKVIKAQPTRELEEQLNKYSREGWSVSYFAQPQGSLTVMVIFVRYIPAPIVGAADPGDPAR